jgi:hypothetical protein
MHRIGALLFLVLLSACTERSNQAPLSQPAESSLIVLFDEALSETLGDSGQQLITEMISVSESEVRALLPGLPDSIEVTVVLIDRDIDVVGGVSGRADAPGTVTVELSSVYPGGVLAAAEAALSSTIFHEFHHLARGWTIQDNRFGPGIPIAAVNEGLASVFSEIYTSVYFEEAYGYPEDAANWLSEIQSLPVDADYSTWMMGQHPDGRNSIGYRVGRFIIHQASEISGLGILELSELSPDEILALVAKG